MLYFFLFIIYNYNGDSMNRESIIVTIKDMNDIKKLKKSNVRYINIDIKNIEPEVIEYLKKQGQNYLYAETINNINGYIYVDYETFIIGEEIIEDMLKHIPTNLNDLEIAKYLYVKLGQKVGYDINTMPEKNETFNFYEINTINNIWGSLCNFKGTNQSYCKIYMYLCSLLGIKCELVSINNSGYLCNKLTINNNSLIVDLARDIPFIEAGFRTKHFANYNDNIELDKKIGYIKDNYCEIKLDKELNDINHDNENFIFKFLLNTQKIIDIKNIKPIELGIIYDIIFSKYCPDAEIAISNLYINDSYNNKEHFILITHNDNHYSYNYNKNSFIKIGKKELVDNIEKEKIGIYLNENIFIEQKYKEVV